MSKISPESIKKFKEIYFKKHQTQLSDEEALILASNLLNLYKLLFSKYYSKAK
ncbi:MAG: hypothetical protein LHV68_12950 [Elusimicrobia bacterium]|nr:hypothetical protein [Candidatus Liberimonas magnetica]